MLEDIPNVGKSIAGDLRSLGIRVPADLKGRNPWTLYQALCRKTKSRRGRRVPLRPGYGLIARRFPPARRLSPDDGLKSRRAMPIE
jgi:hypothetical protein